MRERHRKMTWRLQPSQAALRREEQGKAESNVGVQQDYVYRSVAVDSLHHSPAVAKTNGPACRSDQSIGFTAWRVNMMMIWSWESLASKIPPSNNHLDLIAASRKPALFTCIGTAEREKSTPTFGEDGSPVKPCQFNSSSMRAVPGVAIPDLEEALAGQSAAVFLQPSGSLRSEPSFGGLWSYRTKDPDVKRWGVQAVAATPVIASFMHTFLSVRPNKCSYKCSSRSADQPTCDDIRMGEDRQWRS